MNPVRPTDVESVLDYILRAQEEAAREFRPEIAAFPDSGRRREKAEPLLTPDCIQIDWGRFESLLAKVRNVLGHWTGTLAHNEGSGRSELSEEYRPRLLAEAVKGPKALREHAEEVGMTGLEGDVFALAVRYAFQPFFVKMAEEFSAQLREAESCEPEGKKRFDWDSLDSGWARGRCPVCGAEPFMAEFDREDGHRRLACGLCRTEWRYPRLKCPFCASEDQEDLGFLEVDGLEGFRADVCEACGRYVKTVDRRKVVEQVSFELADARTPELDEAAIERGCNIGRHTETADTRRKRPRCT